MKHGERRGWKIQKEGMRHKGGSEKVYYMLKWISRRKWEKEKDRHHVWGDNGWDFPKHMNDLQFTDKSKSSANPKYDK